MKMLCGSFPSELGQAELGGRMLQEAWVKETVDWEGQEAENQSSDVGQLNRHNFPCRLTGTREPKRSLAWDPGSQMLSGLGQ